MIRVRKGLWDTCKIHTNNYFTENSLACKKQPFLLTLRHWGRFVQRKVCHSVTEIPYWWCKSVISGSHRVPNTNLFNLRFSWSILRKCWVHLQSNPSKTQMLHLEKTLSSQIWAVLLEIDRVYIWPSWPFVFCLSFVNNSWNNVTTPLTNQCFWPDSGQILCHQYGISVAESQTLFLAKRPQRRRVRRNSCFRWLRILKK